MTVEEQLQRLKIPTSINYINGKEAELLSWVHLSPSMIKEIIKIVEGK